MSLFEVRELFFLSLGGVYQLAQAAVRVFLRSACVCESIRRRRAHSNQRSEVRGVSSLNLGGIYFSVFVGADLLLPPSFGLC